MHILLAYNLHEECWLLPLLVHVLCCDDGGQCVQCPGRGEEVIMLWILIVSSVMRQPPLHRETTTSSQAGARQSIRADNWRLPCPRVLDWDHLITTPHLGTLSSAQVSPYLEWAVMVPANTYTTLTTDQCTCLNWPRWHAQSLHNLVLRPFCNYISTR